MSRDTASPAAPSSAQADPGGGRLAALRQRIDAVRRGRAATRRTAAYAALGSAVVAVAVGVFLIDWMLALPKAPRALVLAGAAAVLAWCYRAFVRPWLVVRESDLDLAILVEKQQGVDSDLVAALQFDSPRSADWGSGSLRGAVIDYVAEFSREWRVPSQVAHAAVRSRLGVLGALVACVLVGVALRPDFARAFVNRMLLGSMHYPTRTRIESLAIGGKPVDLDRGSAARASSPIGQPVVFEVGLAGAVPEIGQVRLRSAGGPEADLELRQDGERPAGTFSARLPRLLESVEVEVLAGDAWTDPITLRVVPLPIVETELSATAPSYARVTDAADQAPPRGVRQIAVLEGSQVSLGVTCTNKRLQSAALVVDGTEHALRPGAKDGEWTLPAEGSPLARIVQPVRFEIRVVDEDGLAPETPVTGSIRIKSDGLPQVFADMQTRLTLPEGSPRLDWTVGDDHGIRAVTLLVEPLPAAGPSSGTATAKAEPRSVAVVEMPAAGWVGVDSLPLKGSVAVPIKALGVKKGDQVRVTLQATDHRGDAEGRTISSDPILVDVTDEPGLLASLYESDERGARQLDAILERQLQTGSLPQFRPGRQAGGDGSVPVTVPAPGGSP